ncbi:MAG: DUF4189 domain-containing protein [Acidobacteriota bacterium]
MNYRIVAVAAALLLFTTAGVAQDGEDQYGAIAYSLRTHRYGYSTSERSRGSAERNALRSCRADDCQIKVWFRNNCAALATGNRGSATGWGYDKNPRRAHQRALSECGKYANDCRVIVAACSSDE